MNLGIKTQNGNRYYIYDFMISHYILLVFNAFENKITFTQDIKTDYTPEQLIEIGNFCANIYNKLHQ